MDAATGHHDLASSNSARTCEEARCELVLPSGEEVSPFSNRLCRAHANCYENLPIFAALILLALVTDNAGITDSLARWVLVARVAQSTVHLISTSELAVTLRATFHSVQLGIEAYWVVQLGLLGFAQWPRLTGLQWKSRERWVCSASATSGAHSDLAIR